MEPFQGTAPAAAAGLFGSRLELAVRYVDHLATTGVQWGLLGPREVPRLWDRHVLNCAVIAELLCEGASVADIGSGAGLPGIPLALCRPDLRLVLVEPLLRRAQWLDEVVNDLGLGAQVHVRRERAEQISGSLQVPYVTARAVAPLDRLAAWALPLLSADGELLAMKGRTAAQEVARTREAVHRAGGKAAEIVRVGSGVLDQEVTVVRIRVAHSRPVGQPRRRRSGGKPAGPVGRPKPGA